MVAPSELIRFRLRRRQARIDRLTLALAGTAVVTSVTVVAGEFSRRYRRRLAERRPSAHLPGGPVEAIQLAGRASQDTLVVAIEGYSAASRPETALFNLFSGFVGAFAWARISTAGIRSGWWPLGNVNVKGRHIHHFVPGIVLAFLSGGVAIVTESPELETALAVPFGVGAGLTFDEAALLLDLQDVYWLPRGRLSVQVSAVTVSVLGATILGMRLLKRGEQRGEQAGLIPTAEGRP
ncbi:MAG: hypothetical protein H0V25_11580 [Solirubrobacterales bacterium]|nr:hypothetical protein [Solirubrobacterales bacterium]